MDKERKQRDAVRIWLWAATALSFLINIAFIGKSYMIYLSTDEQVPFAVAAYLNGVDWSSTTQNMAYYSYGYAFILAPIFWLTKSARALYQGAILVNALMASAIVPMAWSIGKKLSRDIPDWLLIAAAFCVAHYSCIIVRTHLALYEMTLIFLTWLLVWLYFSLEESPRAWKYILFGLLLIYGYSVHQRMLGIVLAGGITLAVHCVRQIAEKKNGKKVLIGTLLAAAAAVSVLLLHRYCKDLFKAEIWNGSATANTNDYTGMSGRFNKFLTREGFNWLIKEFFGQMYYMGAATFLFGFVGAFFLIRTNLKTAAALFSRKKKMPEYAMAQLFTILAFLASVGISVLFMAGGTVRADYLIYGRYIEMTFGPVVLIGLLHLLSRSERPALFSLLSLGAMIVCTLITDYSYGNVRGVEFAGVSCIGINVFHYDGYVHVYDGMLWAIGIFTLAFMIFRRCAEWMQAAALVLIAGGWTYIGANLLRNEILPTEATTYEFSLLLEAREPGTEDLPVYYAGPSGKTYEAPFIQFVMKNKVLHYIEIQEAAEIEGDYYIISKFGPIEMQSGYRFIGSANEAFIYRRDESSVTDDVIELPLQTFRTKDSRRTEEGIVSEGAGITMYGPYLTLITGTYRVEIRYRILSDAAEGYFDVCSGEVTHTVSHFSENSCDDDGIYTAEMQFCLVEVWKREEIRCFIQSGQVEILGAKISWVPDMIDLPFSLFATEIAAEDENGVVNTAPGRLFAGPYGIWYAGDYEIRISYEAVSDDLEGSFGLYSRGSEQDFVPIDPDVNLAVMHVEVGSSPLENVDLSCEIVSGQIRITDVTILRKMEGWK